MLGSGLFQTKPALYGNNLLSPRWPLRSDCVSVSDPWRSEVIREFKAPDMPMSIAPMYSFNVASAKTHTLDKFSPAAFCG